MPRRATSTLDESALARLLERQDGVVSRGQLVGLGASRADVRRLLARRELVPVHPRVYVDHSGTLTRRQREWAAVLACAPAALHRESALDAHGMTRDRASGAGDRAIHVLVDREHRVVPPPGVIVETASGAVHRDVRYPIERTLVELDGAFAHRDAVDRWADLQRDLDAAVEDHVTLRPGWAQVLEPCRLAGLVAAVLQSRGWAGAPVRCGSECAIVDSGASGPT